MTRAPPRWERFPRLNSEPSLEQLRLSASSEVPLSRILMRLTGRLSRSPLTKARFPGLPPVRPSRDDGNGTQEPERSFENRSSRGLLRFFCYFCLLTVLGCLGCRSHKRTTSDQTRQEMHPPQPVRPGNPRLTVATNNQAPIRYQWSATNGPDGTRRYRFTPGP